MLSYYEEDNTSLLILNCTLTISYMKSVLDYDRTQLILLTSLNRPKGVGDFVPDIRWNFQSIKNDLKRFFLTWEP